MNLRRERERDMISFYQIHWCKGTLRLVKSVSDTFNESWTKNGNLQHVMAKLRNVTKDIELNNRAQCKNVITFPFLVTCNIT